MTPKASRKKWNMGAVIADGRVEEPVEAVDFAAPHVTHLLGSSQDDSSVHSVPVRS
jgi:hypothetical protein